MPRLIGEFLRVGEAVVLGAIRSVRRNLLLAALSVGLAFTVWIFITDTEHPTRVGILPIDISVLPVNVPDGLTVGGLLGDVRLEIEAPEDVWDRLTADDFRATINLAGAEVGTHDLEVRVELLSERTSVEVIGVRPPTMQVEVKPLVSQLVSVSVEVIGSPPIGYEAAPASVDPERVVVSGSEDLVGRVDAAVTTVDLSGAVADVRQSYPLVPRDERGFMVEGVTLDPTTVDVEVAVEQKQFSRLVAVSPSLRGSPAGGYNVLAVEVEPASVTLLGPLDILNATSVVVTENIDITGATSDVFQTVGLSLPSGVTVSGPATVSVRVRLAAGQGEASFGVAPQWTGLATDLRLASITPLVEVLLSGELPTLGNLSASQIEVTVDLSDLDAGTHRLEPEVQVPDDVEVVSLSPSTVEVVLSAIPEATETPTPTPTPTSTAEATAEPTP